MKIWIRRIAVVCIIAVLLAALAWTVLIEIFLTSYSPNLLLRLLLPVGLAILALAGWRIIVALYIWAPNEQPASAGVG